MHLSILSDSFLSDSLADARPSAIQQRVHERGVAHREGVMRGLVFLGIAGLLVAVLTVSGVGQKAAADQMVVSFSQSASAFGGMNRHYLRGSDDELR